MLSADDRLVHTCSENVAVGRRYDRKRSRTYIQHLPLCGLIACQSEIDALHKPARKVGRRHHTAVLLIKAGHTSRVERARTRMYEGVEISYRRQGLATRTVRTNLSLSADARLVSTLSDRERSTSGQIPP